MNKRAPFDWRSLCLPLLAAALGPAGLAHADLFEYLKRPEPSFRWRQLSNDTTPEGKIFEFELTSQTWRGIPWTHQLRVYEPATIESPGLMLLFITGGSSDSKVKPEDHIQGFALAKACGGRVAVLPQVPNQPLLGGKKEDDLIGETFVNYMKSQEPDWPLLLPMVKSAVRAMDALQEWGRERRTPIDGFIVTGASKRGWTTWLTGAVDSRVKGIAPMVIPTLNMRAQTAYQQASWGFFSEQIEDYTSRGLTEKFDDPVGKVLWRMVDPYSYLDRINVPILQINGTNDRYWTLDSLNLYWNDIKSPGSYVVYLPNAGHGLEQHRAWAINGVGALFRSVAGDIAGPKFTHSVAVGNEGNGRAATCTLTFDTPNDQVEEVRYWTAKSATRDFRESEWSLHGEPIPVEARSTKTIVNIALPPDGYLAVLCDLTFRLGELEYHLSAPISVFDSNGEIKPDVEALSKASITAKP
jgi:PhoPQ-activated pathogenicity-related protein